MINKDNNAYKTIGEVAKELNLRSKNNNNLSTHTIRFWEKEFKQIKPKIFNGNRRYYDNKNIELLKKVKFLLKEEGMTINGVKKILEKRDSLDLDETTIHPIRASRIKIKLNKISNLVKKIKDMK